MERRCLPHRRRARQQGALSSNLGFHACGFARHTNTDNVRHVRRWAGSAALLCEGARRASPAVRGHARSAWCGTSNGNAYPGGKGHTISEAAQTPAITATRPHTGTAPQAREGGRDPLPPSQEDAQTVTGRSSAWKSRDGGDIPPQPQRFWLRRGPLLRPEQAPETVAQAIRTAPLVF